jgi:hypothetical protein
MRSLYLAEVVRRLARRASDKNLSATGERLAEYVALPVADVPAGTG